VHKVSKFRVRHYPLRRARQYAPIHRLHAFQTTIYFLALRQQFGQRCAKALWLTPDYPSVTEPSISIAGTLTCSLSRRCRRTCRSHTKSSSTYSSPCSRPFRHHRPRQQITTSYSRTARRTRRFAQPFVAPRTSSRTYVTISTGDSVSSPLTP